MDQQLISFDDFTKINMVAGTIIEAKPNTKAKIPAYILRIDFGNYGIKTSSAQLTENYTCEDLVSQQIIAVMNFPAKRVAGVKSEVLVLAGVNNDCGTVLLSLTKTVPNGTTIA
jgi:tRNA-binding protein